MNFAIWYTHYFFRYYNSLIDLFSIIMNKNLCSQYLRYPDEQIRLKELTHLWGLVKTLNNMFLSQILISRVLEKNRKETEEIYESGSIVEHLLKLLLWPMV